MKEGFGLVPVDTLGGLCTLMERSDLPVGLAPLAQNVEFFPGGLRTRDGFKAYLEDAAEPTALFRAAADHVDGRGTRHHFVYQGGTGKIGSRTSGVTITPILARLGAPSTFSTMRVASMYGKAYICVSDGRRGIAPTFQVDWQQKAISVGATGAADAVATDDAGGGMLTGVYHFIVAYETASGYITGTTKMSYVAVMGVDNGRFDFTKIPIGPDGTVSRRIFISLVDSFELYNPSALTINDNTTTTLSNIDLSQADIAAGLPFDAFLNLSPPTAHLGVTGYANRLVYWGGDGRLNSFVGPFVSDTVYSSIGLLNLDFSAMEAAAYTWSLGAGQKGEWYVAAAMTAGVVVAGSNAQGETQNYYSITGDGTAVCGLIAQGWGGGFYRPNRDRLGNYYLHGGRKYGIRVRVRSTTAAAGNLKIILYGATSSGPSRTMFTTMTLPLASVGPEWAIYEEDGAVTATAMPSVAMEVYLDNVANGVKVDVSRIEIYDVDEKRGFSSLDISRVFDPESFDVIQGRVTISPNDGQEIRNVFPLRGNLYVAKEHSLYVTQDNGDEPVNWNVEIVSSTVGTQSVHGVGIGDGWVVIASRNGLYYFTGGEPEKISQEIQPTWDLFDWAKGEQIYVAVNTLDQVVVIGGPKLGGGRQHLRLSYSEGWSSPIPTGEGRKWSTDFSYPGPPISYPSDGFVHATPITLDDGSETLAFCVGNYSARLVYEDAASKADYAGNITTIYETAPIGKDMERLLFGEVAAKVRGAGTLAFSYVRPDGSVITLPSKTLTTSPLHDVEVRTHNHDTQLGVRLTLTGTNAYMVLKRLGVWAKDSPSSKLRGY